jgi:hypothetical protein
MSDVSSSQSNNNYKAARAPSLGAAVGGNANKVQRNNQQTKNLVKVMSKQQKKNLVEVMSKFPGFNFNVENSDDDETAFLLKDIDQFKILSDDTKEFEEKRVVLSKVFNDFIEIFIDVLDGKMNNAITLEKRTEDFRKFLWELKKLILFVNSINFMRVKNNVF